VAVSSAVLVMLISSAGATSNTRIAHITKNKEK